MKKPALLTITTYNRPEYLERCLRSINRNNINVEHFDIAISDAGSDNKRTIELIEQFQHTDKLNVFKHFRGRMPISQSLFETYNEYKDNYEFFVNLDGDAIVTNSFLFHNISLMHSITRDEPTKFPITFLGACEKDVFSFFNSNTKNNDGSCRHKPSKSDRILLWSFYDYFHSDTPNRESIGGINMLVHNSVVKNIMLPVLQDCIVNGGNWDSKFSKEVIKSGGELFVSPVSIVEHIGIQSSMGHSIRELPDKAGKFIQFDFFEEKTLVVMIDCVNPKKSYEILNSVSENAFGCFILLTDKKIKQAEGGKVIVELIESIESIDEYNDFLLSGDFLNAIDVYLSEGFERILFMQTDGYIKNFEAFDPKWRKYDYIGAPWWYVDGKNVGNGGFSLRSVRLMQEVQEIYHLHRLHAPAHQRLRGIPREDEYICRTVREKLEEKGIVFAPEEVAERFSIEGYKSNRLYSGQFGFHGHNVVFSEILDEVETIVFNQPFGLGDVLFCIKLANNYIQRGYKVVWPILKHYLGIQKHFPQITFVNKELISIDYDFMGYKQYGHILSIPLRFADGIQRLPYKDCMKSKHMLLNEDWTNWAEYDIKLDPLAATILMKTLGVEPDEKYNLYNPTFRSDFSGCADIVVDLDTKGVHMKSIPGYTLIDWYKVIIHATEIHTVGTSIIYLFEWLYKHGYFVRNCPRIFIYKRKPDEKNFENYNYIMSSLNYTFVE